METIRFSAIFSEFFPKHIYICIYCEEILLRSGERLVPLVSMGAQLRSPPKDDNSIILPMVKKFKSGVRHYKDSKSFVMEFQRNLFVMKFLRNLFVKKF